MIETALGLIVLVILVSVLGRLIKLAQYGLDVVMDILKVDNNKGARK